MQTSTLPPLSPEVLMSIQPRNILLTEGSSNSAKQTLNALGGRHTIDVIDPSAWCQCRFSRYVRRWYRCPSFSVDPIGYLKFLNQLLRDGDYDVLFPTHEQAYLLARVSHHLRERVGLALPNFDAIDRLQNKAEFIRLLQKLELPHPPTSLVRSAAELERHTDYPCFVKGAHGTAGMTVWRVDNVDQMRELITRLSHEGHLDSGTELLLQAPGQGVLSIVQLIFQHGRLVGAHCQQARALGVGGSPVARVSVSHPQVVADMQKLGAATKWHGALFIEYFFDNETRQPQYFEANPRIGETFNAALCGVNLCEQYVRVALGEQVSCLEPGRVGVRSHQGFMVLMAEAIRGRSRRQLFGEVGRAMRRQGLYQASENELTRLSDDWLSALPATVVSTQLLAAPGRAHRIVAKTVGNYSLPETAARAIRDHGEDDLARCFA